MSHFPTLCSWEPDCTVLALAYQDSVELCRTNPRFEAYASLPIPDACSGIWQTRQLFLATPTAILAVFTDPAQEFVQVSIAVMGRGPAPRKAPPPSLQEPGRRRCWGPAPCPLCLPTWPPLAPPRPSCCRPSLWQATRVWLPRRWHRPLIQVPCQSPCRGLSGLWCSWAFDTAICGWQMGWAGRTWSA